MDVTLLVPGAAITAASIVFPAIIALYLLKLRRKPLRVSSTLLWTAAAHDLEANVPLRWLKSSWLLLLHLAIAGLLCSAIGRPAVFGAAGEGKRTVLLIDRSASMGVLDGPDGATRLDTAKERALEMTKSALQAEGATVSVVSFGAQPLSHCSATSTLRVVREAIAEITQTDEAADLLAATMFVDSAADASEESGSPERPHIVMFSDGSFTTARRAVLSSATFSFVRCGPAPSPEGVDNRGIVALAARRDYEDPARVRLLMRVLNAEARARTVVVSLSLNGALSERRPLTIPAATEHGTATASTTFDIPLAGGGLLQAKLDEPDLLASDNSAAVVLPPSARPRITLVRPDALTDPSNSPSISDLLLVDTVAELAPGAMTAISATEYHRRENSNLLAPGELYIFDRVTPNRPPPGPSLSFGSGLASLGLSFEAGAPGTYFLSWQRSHPVLRDVALDTVFITQPLTAKRSAASENRIKQTDLATGASGPLIMLVEDGTVRRMVVGFELDRSNWLLQVGFPIFLAASADFLTLRAEGFAGASFRTGVPFEVTLPGAGGATLELAGPETFTLSLARRDDGIVSVPPLPKVGVYQFAAGGMAAAVNLFDETESTCATTDTAPVKAALGMSQLAKPVRRELWRHLVAIASLLLIVEWLVYAKRAKV